MHVLPWGNGYLHLKFEKLGVMFSSLEIQDAIHHKEDKYVNHVCIPDIAAI